VLSVRELTLDLAGADRQIGLVQGVSFDVHADRIVALIGESGCGKTMTAMAVLGLLPAGIRVVGGVVSFGGRDLVSLSDREMRSVRGGQIGMIFQDPMSSLNPTMTVGDQIIETRRLHLGESASAARRHAVQLLDQVGIPYPAKRVKAFPFELSGGMQQRVMIAMAIACDPQLLIADEPTTALDVTIQAEILELLVEVQRSRGMGILLVTHDLGVVADYADDVVVMYAGHVVEHSRVDDVFAAPQHPYTAALLGAIPQGAEPRTPLLTIAGRVPPAGQFVPGCRFQTRCPHAREDICRDPAISAAEVRPGHLSQCLRVQRGELVVTNPKKVATNA
jgi:oligopeptide transport system ATP-binding protein